MAVTAPGLCLSGVVATTVALIVVVVIEAEVAALAAIRMDAFCVHGALLRILRSYGQQHGKKALTMDEAPD